MKKIPKETTARVTSVRKNLFLVNDGTEERLVPAQGKLYHPTDGEALFPATGDWVRLNEGCITAVLPRKNALSRGASRGQGKKGDAATQTQVMAANIDTVFIVCGLDRDFNLRRIERYLTLVYNCGCTPVVILSKADLHRTPAPFVQEVESIAFGVPIHPVSAMHESGIETLEAYLTPGQTVALLGSSGAGKSTLVNLLSGKEVQATREVSHQGGKGVHTTTTRDLIQLPSGGVIIDNPGIREVAFWDTEEGTESSFPDIESWSTACRFSNCTHESEPGCRVQEACKRGELSLKRLESYKKQKRELDYLSQRTHKSADRLEKERWKGVSQFAKKIKREGK